jgi:hypothetical protein
MDPLIPPLVPAPLVPLLLPALISLLGHDDDGGDLPEHAARREKKTSSNQAQFESELRRKETMIGG